MRSMAKFRGFLTKNTGCTRHIKVILASPVSKLRDMQDSAEKLTELFHCLWRKEAIPKIFKVASIIHRYKRTGNPQVCDNHRGISLLSIAGKIVKILAKILLNRLNVHLDQKGLIPEGQCGFRKDRGTIDTIFTTRQLQHGHQFISFIAKCNDNKFICGTSHYAAA